MLPLSEFVSRFQLQLPPVARRYSGCQRQAAVLIPIICRPEPSLLLTQRATTLRRHPGQIAFPGGGVEPEDNSLVATALREAQEEVAIPPLAVTVLGQLTPLDSSSGYQVTPVVGLIPPNIPFYCNNTEVESIFEIPLQVALTLSRYYALNIYHRGKYHQIYLSWYDGQFIWGLTAAIIRQLAQQVSK